MEFLINDRWQATFTVQELGVYKYTVRGWVDRTRPGCATSPSVQAGQDVTVDLQIGAQLVEAAAAQSNRHYQGRAGDLCSRSTRAARRRAPGAVGRAGATDGAARRTAVHHHLSPGADHRRRSRARSSARGTSSSRARPHRSPASTGHSATWARLPYVASMGFDVLYLPPIHPIGTAFRRAEQHHYAGPG